MNLNRRYQRITVHWDARGDIFDEEEKKECRRRENQGAASEGYDRNQQAVYSQPRGRASVDYLASSGVFLIRSQSSTIDHLSFVMAFQGSSWLAATLALFSFFSMLIPANALYFYVDGRQTKCFFEDLPKDTLVAGMRYQFTFSQKLYACDLAAELIFSLFG